MTLVAWLFLLSTNNLNYENLISGVAGAGTNANSFVNGALRPGRDKVTFTPHPVDPQSGQFLPTTNYFTDIYLTNGIRQQQQLLRIISRPDFLSARAMWCRMLPEFHTLRAPAQPIG